MHNIHVAIPCLDEEEALPSCLDALARQTRPADMIWVCVNQPDSWWERPDRMDICQANHRTLETLRKRADLPLTILDRSSPGKGWPRGKAGVGHARAHLFAAVASQEGAQDQDLFVSLDADTIVAPGYLESVEAAFQQHPGAVGLAAPYHHRLPAEPALRRAILRYEIYLRSYFLNMAATASPQLFTALGSAIALPLGAGRKVSGPPARPAGEDFYLLQKLAKIGPLALWTHVAVQPSARPSRRVPFGTGPAVAQGMEGRWDAYPIFDPSIFDEVADALDMLGELHHHDLDHPLFQFLQTGSNKPLWPSLRRNHPDPRRFVRACHERIDGLRILQYVRWRTSQSGRRDAKNLVETLHRRAGDMLDAIDPRQVAPITEALSALDDPASLDLRSLEIIRDILARKEDSLRQERTIHWQTHLAFYGMGGHGPSGGRAAMSRT